MRNALKYIPALLLLQLLTGNQLTRAQNAPSTTARPNATPVSTPANYQNGQVTYIRTWEPKLPTTDYNVVKSSSRTPAEVIRNTEYLDGLGRPIQTVTKQVSPSGKDLVRMTHYDSIGREQYSYLPYTPKTGNTNDGFFKQDAYSAQKAFYQDLSLNPGAAGELVYYGQTEYEKSMLNRVKRVYSPGDSWAKFGGNHPSTTAYAVNLVADSVRLWTMGTGVIPGSSSFYNPRSLHKTISTDPNGRQVVEYKDQDDLTVLRKVQLSASPGTAHVGWACTYYVYDLLRNLRFVIQPKGVEAILSNWTLSSTVVSELCFIYRYDSRQRMIVEKMPGADSIEYVYNKRDKVAMWRDGNLKQTSRWKVFRYDGQGREILKALFTYNYTRQQWEDHFNAYPYSDTSAIPAGSDNNLFPLVYTYYDNYDFAGKSNYDNSDINKVQAGSNPYAQAIPGTPSNLTRGLLTGKRVRVEQLDVWLNTTVYYNDKGRTIQIIKDNIAGGKNTVNHLYDFSGKILSSYVRHTNPKSPLTPVITQLVMNHYDAAGRLDSVKERINDNGPLETIAVMTYDELGRLKTKRLGVTGASTQLETLSYEYNLQDWMTAINKSYVNTIGSTSNWFGEQLSFDSGFTKLQYNGNIAGSKWKSRSDGLGRLYGYEYNTAENLIRADFLQQNNGSSNWTNDKVDFSVRGISYDINGNIQSMKQIGMDGMSIKTIDSLKYGYLPTSNKLSWVTDKVNNPQSKLGDFKEVINNETADYTYNSAGFLSQDHNKGIASVLYNHNNIPAVIADSGRGRIDYQTSGEGDILCKIVNDTSIAGYVDVTYNIDGFTYRNDTLESISHAEGRTIPVIKNGVLSGFRKEYFIRDHLNSVREVLTTRSDTSTYAASMETSRSALENALFSNIDLTRSAKPSGYPSDPTTNPNDYVIKLNAQNGQKIGPGKALYVQAGDTIQVAVKAFYKSAAANVAYSTPAQMLSSIIQTFIGTSAANGVHNATGPDAPITTNFTSGDYTTLQNSDPSQNLSDKPRAFLTAAAFDLQFNLVPGNSYTKQVQGSPDAMQNVVIARYTIQKTGYFYFYVSNESAQDVYFDNFMIIHTSGPNAQSNHYYPFGVKMAGISTQAFTATGYSKNRLLFNGKELHSNEYRDGGSLDWYDFGSRMYDQQIGRWMVIDPKSNQMRRFSPYAFAFNNPIRFIDPDGMKPFTDYYNLEGRLVKKTPENPGTTALVITKMRDDATVSRLISEGKMVMNAGEEFIGALKEAYERTEEKNKTEHFFSIGIAGKVSPVHAPEADLAVRLSDWEKAWDDVREMGDEPEIEVHTHVNEKNEQGEVVNRGIDAPSTRATTVDGKDGDMEVTTKHNDGKMKIVGGYRQYKYQANPMKQNDPFLVKTVRSVAFWNKDGFIEKIDFDELDRIVKKMARQHKRDERREKKEEDKGKKLDAGPAQ